MKILWFKIDDRMVQPCPVCEIRPSSDCGFLQLFLPEGGNLV